MLCHLLKKSKTKIIHAIYPLHEIARALATLSRHYGGVQWVFSPPVHSLPSDKSHFEPSDRVKANHWVCALTLCQVNKMNESFKFLFEASSCQILLRVQASYSCISARRSVKRINAEAQSPTKIPKFSSPLK